MPSDHLRPRRELGDVQGRAKPERMSEYFDFAAFPEKRDRKVTRQELLAFLTRQWLVQRESRWHRRLWRWLGSKLGSMPEPVGGGARTNGEDPAA